MIDGLEKGDILFSEPDQFRIVLSDIAYDTKCIDGCIVLFENCVVETSVFWEENDEYCLKLK